MTNNLKKILIQTFCWKKNLCLLHFFLLHILIFHQNLGDLTKLDRFTGFIYIHIYHSYFCSLLTVLPYNLNLSQVLNSNLFVILQSQIKNLGHWYHSIPRSIFLRLIYQKREILIFNYYSDRLSEFSNFQAICSNFIFFEILVP
jgi:hypothetical protein